jgi:hypothetical protein
MVISSALEGRRHRALPLALIIVPAFIFLSSGIGPNFALALFSVVVLFVGNALLFRPGESPILLVMFGWQWIQASISIYYANWLDKDVQLLAKAGGDQERAIALTLMALLFVAFGMRAGSGPAKPQIGANAREIAFSFPISRWFSLYATASAAALICLTFGWIIPALSQIAVAAAALKWAFFFMLAYASFLSNRQFGYLYAAFAFEFLLGFGGYFSDFKTVFIFVIIALFMSKMKISIRLSLTGAIIAIVLIALGVVWTAVKKDYRQFISAGQSAQIVTTGYAENMIELAGLISNLDGEKLEKATEDFILRVTYVEFFGIVLNYVPDYIPHEQGALLWDSVSRPFMPRLFFPTKTAIDDTKRTEYYTGGAAGEHGAVNLQGTSLSLGYICECYIDFGEAGMMIAVTAIGYFYGWIYRVFCNWKRAGPLFGTGLASSILFGAAQLESSFTKIFGGIIVSILVAWVVCVYLVNTFYPWVTGKQPA